MLDILICLSALAVLWWLGAHAVETPLPDELARMLEACERQQRHLAAQARPPDDDSLEAFTAQLEAVMRDIEQRQQERAA